MNDNMYLCAYFFILPSIIVSVELVFWHGIAITYAKNIKKKTGRAERVKERAIERGWWVQPVSVSPPSDLARRQNGLTDSCHRKHVSLTRNLDEESSKVVKSRNALFNTPRIKIRASNQAAKKIRFFYWCSVSAKELSWWSNVISQL